MPRIRRINADYFLTLSASIHSIRADPRSIPQWLSKFIKGPGHLEARGRVAADDGFVERERRAAR